MPVVVLIGCLAALAAPIGGPAGAVPPGRYQEPVPGYQEPPPGWREPEPGWREAPPGLVEPDPVREPAPGNPGRQEPDPGREPAPPAPGQEPPPGVPGAPQPGPGGPGAPAPGGAVPGGAVPSSGTGTGPSGSPSPRPRGTPRAKTPVPPSVSVAVAGGSTDTPTYRIQVRNPGTSPLDTTVRQTLPRGSAATSISDGGRATRSADRANPSEVTWQVTVPASGTTTVRAAIRPARPGQAVVTPACVYARTGGTPYDCATATWRTSAAPAGDTAQPAPWRRPAVFGGALLALVALGVGGPWWWRRHHRRAAYPAPTGPVDPAAAERVRRGTVYPVPSAPRPVSRRRRPPVWLVVTTAAALLALVVGAGAWVATTRVSAMHAGPQPTSGAWVGTATVGAVGSTLRENAFEFTVYRLACPPGGTRRQCEATVGVRNLTSEKQPWHGQLQRAYLPGGTWVGVDETATRLANQGRDVFGTPVPAGGRLLAPLVFTVDGPNPPSQLELRSGVFSAGVRINLS
ncbi:hypothetical protein [Micromonospora echinofusca]|uniref:DUF4352 domain-containing protein n=1 Tax=Micromonospora echinofusca TaxID=47858 RepID=A0ABS3VYG9_MICEH|nr:hypothetical protein [Micromonospora echinofusca]MBO4209586.1 hypothetical protein [Micromonospora echinofusca]